jgi:hypothetical protein
VRILFAFLVFMLEVSALIWGLITVSASGFYLATSALWWLFKIGIEPDPLIPPVQITQLAFLYGFPFIILGVFLEFVRRRMVDRLRD